MDAFSWPVTDDHPILSNALAHVLAAHGRPADQLEKATRDAAATLIIEAYSQGVRDERVLADYTLRALERGRSAT
jgi:hypothetical protein